MSKVAIVKCQTYEIEEVQNAIKRGIMLLGGIKSLIPEIERVLLKPNLLASSNPDKAVTTHPVVFEGVIRLFQENGYILSYGDSPGFENPEKVAVKCGLKAVSDRYGIKFGDFTGGQTVTYEEGTITKQFEIAKAVLESEAIISLCKMKTHQLTRITGAVKNQLGCVYGLHKSSAHAKFPDAISFSKMLVDLNKLLKPKLFIMDGIVAMEGNGPRSGNPVKMDVLLFSDDPVALDSVFCRLIDLDPEYIPSIMFGEELELGKWRDHDIEILGDKIQDLKNDTFNVIRKPVISENFGFAAYFRNIVLRKPVIDSKKCIRCGICVDACPVEGKALNFRYANKSQPPEYYYKKCIRCYCCQEMCPQKAIDVKTPLLGRMFLYR